MSISAAGIHDFPPGSVTSGDDAADRRGEDALCSTGLSDWRWVHVSSRGTGVPPNHGYFRKDVRL